MIFKYNDFLLERNNIKKIQKFANVPEIYNWAHEKDENLSIWLADKMVKLLKDRFKSDKKYLNYFNKYLNNTLTKDDFQQLKSKFTDDQLTIRYNEFSEDIKYQISRVIDMRNNEFTKVLHYVNSPLHANRPNINNLSLEEAVELSDEWHKEQEKKAGGVIEDEDGEVILSFPDGYYWIDTQSTSCSAEAEAMGHCGHTTQGTTMLSLRKDKRPHVTIAYNEDDNIFTQIKGKGNTKPNKKYHTYIVDLIIDLNVEKFKSEYNRSSDFVPDDLSEELYAKLEEENSDYIENSKGLTEEELKEKYKEDIKDDIARYASQDSYEFFQHINDDKFISEIIENEISQTGKDDLPDYMTKDQLKEWIIDNIDEDELREHINGYIMLTLNDENADVADIKSFTKLLKRNEKLEIDKLLTREGYKTSDDFIELLYDMGKIEDVVRNIVENRYDGWDARQYYENIYGDNEVEIEKDFVNFVIKMYDVFDEDGFADSLVDNADEDQLENYNT